MLKITCLHTVIDDLAIAAKQKTITAKPCLGLVSIFDPSFFNPIIYKTMKHFFYSVLFFGFLFANNMFAAEDIVINVLEDAYVQWGDHANEAKGVTDPTQLVIKHQESSAPNNRRKIYLKFALPDTITIGHVYGAELSLHVKSCNASIGTPTWNLYSVSDSWSESTITWNTQPTENSVFATYNVPGGFAAGYNIIADITDRVKEAINTNERTFSIQIFPSVANNFGNAELFSKENTTDVQKIPQLILFSEPRPIIDNRLSLEIADSIIMRMRRDKLSKSASSLNSTLASCLPKMKSDGSFDDIDYAAQSRSNWEPLIHLERLREMGLAYTHPESQYFESADIYAKILKGFEYWYARNVNNTMNWYYNRVAHPHRLGEALIAVYPGKQKITEEDIFTKLTKRWKDKYGHPDNPSDATTAGANKSNIAMHWIYRSALTRNKEDLEFAAERGFFQLAFTTGEGIQHDYSYRQHGAQLYLAGYGREFIQLATRQAYYLVETPYALADERREILSRYVRDTYLNIIRGERLSYNIFGRSISRENATSEKGFVSLLSYLVDIDPDNASEYESAIKRIRKEETASYNVKPFQTHYYRGEYTLHVRPGYLFDVRMASNRMARSEYDIYENRQGFFLTDGANCIMVDGEEYGTILPLWDWRRIPGTTAPELETMVRADTYIRSGRSSHAGGVTDGMYGVTSFQMINDQELYAHNDDIGFGGTPNPQNPRLPALDFGAKKSWFTFDKEIVCLGADIYSGHDQPISTTVNQCRRVGEVIVCSNGTENTVGAGTVNYQSPDWVLNDKVAYFFPERCNVSVENRTETAKWSDINASFATDTPFEGKLFTLWINHGIKPTNERYAYIIVPNANLETARNYTTDDIVILANNDSVQAVYHKGADMYGFAFFKAASFRKGDLALEVNAASLIMIKDADKEEVTLYVSDPQKSGRTIEVGIETTKYKERKVVLCENIASPHTGKSVELKVNASTPLSDGKEVFLDRTDWIITTSSEGPSDAAVGGTDPNYIIDGDNVTSFLFVKPGKTYGGVSVPADAAPHFTIDLQEPKEMHFFIYRHRVHNNTGENLRVRKASFYGKNNEADDFEPIVSSEVIATDANEVKIGFPEAVSYRYVRFVYEDWNTASGNTMQVSEFNLGKKVLFPIDESEYTPSDINGMNVSKEHLSVYPNPIRRGDVLSLKTSLNIESIIVEIRDMLGRTVKSGNQLTIDTNGLDAGVHLITIKETQSNRVMAAKLIVN